MLPPDLIPILLIYASFFSLEFLHLSPIFDFLCCLFMHLSTLSSQNASSAPGLIQQDFCWLFMPWAPSTQNTGPPAKSQELYTYLTGAKTEVFPNLSNSSRIRCSNSSNTSTKHTPQHIHTPIQQELLLPSCCPWMIFRVPSGAPAS